MPTSSNLSTGQIRHGSNIYLPSGGTFFTMEFHRGNAGASFNAAGCSVFPGGTLLTTSMPNSEVIANYWKLS